MNLDQSQKTIVRLTKKASDQLVGLEVKLSTVRAGKYNGRIGVVHAVMPDAKHGLMVLVMIFYKGQSAGGYYSSAYLNTDAATRKHWPLESVTFTGRRCFVR